MYERNPCKNCRLLFWRKAGCKYGYDEIGKGSVFTYGPIIHNEEVVADLKAGAWM